MNFSAHLFSPAMPKSMPMRNISLPLAAIENASMTLKKIVFGGK